MRLPIIQQIELDSGRKTGPPQLRSPFAMHRGQMLTAQLSKDLEYSQQLVAPLLDLLKSLVEQLQVEYYKEYDVPEILILSWSCHAKECISCGQECRNFV